MKIEFTRSKPPVSSDYRLDRKGLPRIHRITFCCEDLADNVMQVPCFLSTEEAELWFHPNNVENGEFFMRFCPFCGTKIETIETKEV